jgi:hypothetical protein
MTFLILDSTPATANNFENRFLLNRRLPLRLPLNLTDGFRFRRNSLINKRGCVCVCDAAVL